MSWSAQTHLELPHNNLRDAEAKPAHWIIFKFPHCILLAFGSHVSYFSFSMVINKVRVSSPPYRKKPVSFILILFLGTLSSMSLILVHVLICVVTLRHETYTYLHDHPPRCVYSYVMLCCYYMGWAFTLFHLVLPSPSCWWVMYYSSWLLSSLGMAGADFNLVTFEQWAPSGGSPVVVMKPHQYLVRFMRPASCPLLFF